MKFISTKIHGYLDYAIGILLVALPALLSYNPGGPEGIILYACGAAILVMALITRYELAILRIVPMALHLIADIIVGAFLAVAPVVFEFSERALLPYTLSGLFVIISSYYTTSTLDPGAGPGTLCSIGHW